MNTPATPTADAPSPPPPKPLWRRVLRRMLIFITVLYLAWCTTLYFAQTFFIFPRQVAGHSQPGAPVPAGVERLEAKAPGGHTLEAWFIKGDGRSADSPGPTVIFFHGNGELIDHCVQHTEAYTNRGISVLLPEYRGYGRTGGTPSEAAIVSDMEGWYDRLITRPEVDTTRIFFHGRSLGGGIAAQLAPRRAPAALIVESTFTSVASFAKRMLVPTFFLKSPFRTDKVIGTLNFPILILHGTQDDIIPVEHGRALAKLKPEATYIELAGRHNDFPHNWDAYWKVIDDFLAEHRLQPQAK